MGFTLTEEFCHKILDGHEIPASVLISFLKKEFNIYIGFPIMQASRWKEGEPALSGSLVFKGHQQLICYSLKEENTGKKNPSYEMKINPSSQSLGTISLQILIY